ncbi:HAMP domain-containing histidine kinase [Candidatus Saccharibacteria bacterium]|nr:HAMP domain-containing histidine kinase [Candidatus Saccharibacteria bacterium]
MFKKLRNKLVLINVSITTVVILLVFSAIYMISTRMAEERRPIPNEIITLYSDETENILEVSIRNEKQKAAEQLLVALIVSGIAIELAVIIVSYILADEAIKPVKEAYETQKVFIANASHEIKTPLAAIAANLEAADISDNKWIRNVEIETEKLTKLNGELLTLARTDLMNGEKTEKAEIGTTAKKLLESFEPRLIGKKFEYKIEAGSELKVNKTDFEQVVSILMDNAVKYSKSFVNARLVGKKFTVENDGAVIPKEKLAHVFDRFYQVDKSSDGVGLGLSIAKAVAERNHWKLSVNSDEKSTIFTVEI